MEYLHPASGQLRGRHSSRAKPRAERRRPADRVFDSAKPVNQQNEADMVGQGRIRRFETVPHREFSTPSRKRGGVLVYGSATPAAPVPGGGKSRYGGGFGASRPSHRALGLEAEPRGPTATPTVALAPPAATLSDSRALWLTPPAR